MTGHTQHKSYIHYSFHKLRAPTHTINLSSRNTCGKAFPTPSCRPPHILRITTSILFPFGFSVIKAGKEKYKLKKDNLAYLLNKCKLLLHIAEQDNLNRLDMIFAPLSLRTCWQESLHKLIAESNHSPFLMPSSWKCQTRYYRLFHNTARESRLPSSVDNVFFLQKNLAQTFHFRRTKSQETQSAFDNNTIN